TYRIASIANERTYALPNWAVIPTQDALDYDGYLVYAPAGLGGRKLVAARYANGRWEYDNDSIFTPFVPAEGDFAFASFRRSGNRFTDLRSLRCAGACGAINGLAIGEVVTGQLNPDTTLWPNAGPNSGTGMFDAGEILASGDGQRRGFVVSRGFTSLTLASLDGGAVAVQPGDTLRGVYHFDTVRISSARVVTEDLFEAATPPQLTNASLLSGNEGAPAIDAAKIAIRPGLRGPVLTGNAGAIVDGDAVMSVAARNLAASTPHLGPTFRVTDWASAGTVGGVSLMHIDNGRRGAAAASLQRIGANGYLAFVASQADRDLQAGLAPADTVDGYNEPGHMSFRLLGSGTYQVWANAAYSGKSGSYTAGTPFRIEKTPSAIRWYVDDAMVHEHAASIPASMLMDVVFDSTAGEISAIELVDGTLSMSTFHAKVNTDGSFTIPISGAPGDAIVIRARDRHVYSMETKEVSVGAMPNDIGVATVTLAANEVTGGRSTTGTVTLLSAAGSQGALVVLSSNVAGVTVPAAIAIGAGQISGTFTVTTVAVTSPVDATISAAYGLVGANATLKVVKDSIAPAVTVTSPAPNSQYTEGSSTIAVQADVTDADSGVKRVYATLHGQTIEMPKNTSKGPNAYFAQIAAPYIDGSQPVTMDLVVNALDNNDNTASAPAVPVVINPIVDNSVPTIDWRCSSSNSLYPAGYDARLRVYAKAPNATNVIQKVEFTVTGPAGGATVYPAVFLGNDLYEHILTIPDVADGTHYTVRARVVVAGGGQAVTDGSFTVLAGATEIRSNTTISSTNTSYDNKTVVVGEGVTLTIDGKHTFDRLAVLVNGRVQHSEGGSMDIAASAISIACGATIDATGRGYAPWQSYGGTATPGHGATAPSHIGIGGSWVTDLMPSYGSVYRPAEPGGSGGARGGGVIALASTKLANDGAIRADGIGAFNSGAGGSIR
ncbi:MAG TPA: Ig-like domain-containing protein, partial [Thermoanaerobaculia bacterium]|nr:Ig-like domain-containing protein [Thermoanaerobaculia bacterium]